MAGRDKLYSISGEAMETEAEEDIFFKHTRKNLLEEFSKTNVSQIPETESMKVFLRIRPFSEEEISNSENQNCLKVEDEHSVTTNAPRDSHTYRNCAHGLGKTSHKFTFSKIFDQDCMQKEFFNQTMLGLVKDFIDGQNCLVFSYGVTSSGKTYTIQGKPSDAGILPRALDVLFNSIHGKQMEGLSLKPKMFTDVVKLSNEQQTNERRLREKILKMSNDDEPTMMSLLGEDASDISQATNTTTSSESSNVSCVGNERLSKDLFESDRLFTEIENRVREEAAVCVEDQGKILFSIWVSFAEIYNEQIFDLLVPLPKKKNARRPVLRISDDRNGSPYIKGLTELNVTNADEAYRLLTIGQQNLRMACTKLNHQSSRSHCIFNIKIVRVNDIAEPQYARVSTLSLCDLAGSERCSKTQTGGTRLKEAGNINTSLLTLGRCIEMLRYNQVHRDKQKIIPFRDSKLTRLFQNFFCGRGKAAMIVNVNQCSSMFDETLHVFKFSAIAKQVTVIANPVELMPPPTPKNKNIPANRPPPNTIGWETPGTMIKMKSMMKAATKCPLPDDDKDDDFNEEEESEEVQQLVSIIGELMQKLKQERQSKVLIEQKLREEICQEMKEQFVAIEKHYSDRIRETEIEADELVEKRVQILMDGLNQSRPSPKKRKLSGDSDEEGEWVSSLFLHRESVKLKEKCAEADDLKNANEKLKEENEKSKSEIRNLNQSQAEKTQEITSLQFKLSELESKVKDLESIRPKSMESVSSADLSSNVLVENLTHNLQETQEKLKLQKEEMEKLNEMLEEAGAAFEEKEKIICSLREEIESLSSRAKEQEAANQELEEALKESKLALQEAHGKILKGDSAIQSLMEEKSSIEGELTTFKNCVGFLEESIKKKDSEVASWKGRAHRAEEDSLKQEQALINGYKAEINNLKQQIHELKRMSPQKDPRQEAADSSILKSPRKKLKTEDEDHKFKHNLSEQLKILKKELDSNVQVTAELQQALQIARSSSEDLEQRLQAEKERHCCILEENKVKEKEHIAAIEELKQTIKCLKMQIEEGQQQHQKLEEKIEEVETVNASLREMVNATTHQIEEKDNKLKEAEDKVKDMESTHQQPLSPMSSLQKTMKALKSENDGLKTSLQNFEEKVEKIKSERDKAKSMYVEKEDQLHQMQVNVKDLEFQLDEIKIDKSGLLEENGENDIHIKMMEEEIVEKKDKIKQLESLLSEKDQSLLNLNDEMNKLQVANDMLQEDLNENMTSLGELQTQVEEVVSLKEEKERLDKQLQEVQSATDKQEQKVKALESEKEELSARVEELEEKIRNMSTTSSKAAKLKDELNMETIQKLKRDLLSLQEVTEQEKDDLCVKVDALKAELAQIKDHSKKQCSEKDKMITSLTDAYEKTQKELDDRLFQIKDLKNELSKVTAERDSLMESLQDAEDTYFMCEDELAILREKLMSKKKVIKELQAELEQHISKEDEDRDEEDDRVLKLEKDMAEKQEVIEELQKHIEELQKKLDQKMDAEKQILSDFANEKNEFQNGLQKLEKDMVEKNEHLSKCMASNTEKEEEMSSLKSNLEQLKEQKDSFEKKCHGVDELQELVRSLEEQLVAAEQYKMKFEKSQEKLQSSFDTETELGKVKLQLATVTSTQHMAQTLHQQAKKELFQKAKEISDLRAQLEAGIADKHLVESLQEEVEQLRETLKEYEEKCEKFEHKYKECELNFEKSEEKLGNSLAQEKNLKEESDKIKKDFDEKCKAISLLESKIETLKSQNADVLGQHKKEIENLQEELARSKDNTQQEIQALQMKFDSELSNGKTANDVLIEELHAKSFEKDNEIKQLKEKVANLQEQLSEIQQELDDKSKSLVIVENKLSEKEKLCVKQHTVVVKCSELEDHCSKLETQLQKLEDKLKQAENEHHKKENIISNLQQKGSDSEKLEKLVKEKEQTLQDLQSEVKRLQDQSTVKRNNSYVESSVIRELREKLKREEVKNVEYQRLLDDLKLKDCLSPGAEKNSVRNLRREKIDTENKLFETQWKLKELQTEVEKLKKKPVDPQASVSVHNKSELLTVCNENSKCQKELTECKKTIGVLEKKCSDLEGQLRKHSEMDLRFSSPSRTDQLQRSAVSVCVTSPTVHRELDRSQEREQKLRKQLQSASTTIQDLGDKITELEQQLCDKTRALNQAEDKLKLTREMKTLDQTDGSGTDVEQLKCDVKKQWTQIQDLQADLMKKEEKLHTKSQTVKDLQSQIETERDKFEAALRDAKANEAMLEVLKNALAEQEDTMEKQDAYLKCKEDEIRVLNQDIEKVTDKYRQMLEASGDSGKEIRELNRENARLISEVHSLGRQLHTKEEEIQSAATERNRINSLLKEAEDKCTSLEKCLQESQKECTELQKRIATSGESDDKQKMANIEQQLKTAMTELNKKNMNLKVAIEEVKDKEEQLKKWRAERDKLVSGLEALMKKQQSEIQDLKQQLKESSGQDCDTSDVIIKQECVDDDIINDNEDSSHRHPQKGPRDCSRGRKEHSSDSFSSSKRTRHRSSSQRERHQSKRRDHIANVELLDDNRERVATKVPENICDDMTEQRRQPPPRPEPPNVKSVGRQTSRRGRKRRSASESDLDTRSIISKRGTFEGDITFNSEEGSISEHLQIDATPPVAAKALRKTRKKRSTTNLKEGISTDKENAKPSQRSSRKGSKGTEDKPSTLKRIGSLVNAIKNSPLSRASRSAKKLDDISELPSPTDDPTSKYVFVEDNGTQMSPLTGRHVGTESARKRHRLYSESVDMLTEASDLQIKKSPEDAHGAVQRRLRSRRH